MSALGHKRTCAEQSPLPTLTSSGLLRSWFLDLPHKISLHGRPLGCNNAVDASVPECAVLSYLMATQYTVQFCAQPLYAMSTLVIEKMSPKLNCDTMRVSNACLRSKNLHCVLTSDRWTLFRYQVPPISKRRWSASTFR